MLDEISVIADLCLCMQRCAVQATGKVIGAFVLQECARWLNLAGLTDREKDDILNMWIAPKGIFSSALASMQQRCEVKKTRRFGCVSCGRLPPPMAQGKEFSPGTPAPPQPVQK